MKQLYYPIFKVKVNGKEVDFENTYGEGRFATSFIEEQSYELEGIRLAKKWKVQFNKETDHTVTEQLLIDFVNNQTDLPTIKELKIVSVDYYYSLKVYCYECEEWYYADDSCECSY